MSSSVRTNATDSAVAAVVAANALLEKPLYVVANKMDEAVAEENLKKFKRRIRKVPVLPIAAGFDQGIDAFKQLIREAVV